MSSFNHTLYFYATSPFDHSRGAFDPASAPVAVNDATDTKTNHLARTSSLTDIRNLPGPSATTTHNTPSSPPYLPDFDLWDENAFPPIDLPLPDPPVASQPQAYLNTRLQPPYASSSEGAEDHVEHGNLSVQVPDPSDQRGIWEVSPVSIDADEGGRILAEVTYLRPSESPLEPDFLGESEYARARRQLEFQQPPSEPPSEPRPESPARPKSPAHPESPARPESPACPESPTRPFVRLPTHSAERTTAASSSSGSGTAAELPRRSQREKSSAPQTTAPSSSKGKGKEVDREAVPMSTSSEVSRKPKRKREASGDALDVAAAAPAPPPALKKKKLTTEQVEEMMVLLERLPEECGCGGRFEEQTVAKILEHFAGHYSDGEKSKGTLRCRWGECKEVHTYAELVRHVKGEHLHARWPCPNCGVKYTRPNGVTRHQNSETACLKNQAAAAAAAAAAAV